METIQSQSSTLISGWSISIPVSTYLLYCAMVSVAVRIVLSTFKALAISGGEHLDASDMTPSKAGDNSIIDASFGKRWLTAFWGFSSHRNIRDYWLPAIIGFCEMAAYPVLLFTNEAAVIGGWLAIKTAGQWGVWERSRTAFNRFLVGNLVVLAISFFWLLRYISR